VRPASTRLSSSISTSIRAAVEMTARKAVTLIIPPLKKAKISLASSVLAAKRSSIPSDSSDPSNSSGPIVIDDDVDVVDTSDSPAAELDAEAKLGAFANPTNLLCILSPDGSTVSPLVPHNYLTSSKNISVSRWKTSSIL
jgi:hypothetical protein